MTKPNIILFTLLLLQDDTWSCTFSSSVVNRTISKVVCLQRKQSYHLNPNKTKRAMWANNGCIDHKQLMRYDKAVEMDMIKQLKPRRVQWNTFSCRIILTVSSMACFAFSGLLRSTNIVPHKMAATPKGPAYFNDFFIIHTVYLGMISIMPKYKKKNDLSND